LTQLSNLRLGAAPVEDHEYQTPLPPEETRQALRVRLGRVSSLVLEQQRCRAPVASEVEDADPTSMLTLPEPRAHVGEGLVMQRRWEQEPGFQ
jgi:hypothetical protein